MDDEQLIAKSEWKRENTFRRIRKPNQFDFLLLHVRLTKYLHKNTLGHSVDQPFWTVMVAEFGKLFSLCLFGFCIDCVMLN